MSTLQTDEELIAILTDPKTTKHEYQIAVETLYLRTVPKIEQHLKLEWPIQCQNKKAITGYRNQISLDEVKSIANDCFLRFLKNAASFRQDCSLLTWLTGCNLWYSMQDHFTKNKRYIEKNANTHSLSELSDQAESIADERIQAVETVLCYKKCLEKFVLSGQQQDATYKKCLQALTLRAAGYSIEEIAEKIGKTVGATNTFFATTCKKRILDNNEDGLKRCYDSCKGKN